jgi:two-component system, OmpR family, response regulator
MKILIVEDDKLLKSTLCYNLSILGYCVDSAISLKTARNYLKKQQYNLVVLDVNLPDGNGFEFCKEIKKHYVNTAIIFLTACDMEKDQLHGFEMGADDYVTKPFPISVFQKKVEAFCSRIIKHSDNENYDDGNLLIDFTKMKATIAGEAISFTATEYRILKIFINNLNIVLTRSVLLKKLWDSEEKYVDEHALTCAVSRIRSKIEIRDTQYIKTVYGMGYIWIGGVRK